MHALGDDVTLPSFLLHHLSLCQPKFVLFVFGYQTVNIIIFRLHLNRRRENQHSSLKLFSSNVRYFCFVFVQQLFLFIY